MYVVSVGKTYTHRGKHRHRDATKKHWFVYFITEAGKFGSKRIHPLTVPYYKSLIKKHKLMQCTNCQTIFYQFYKGENELEGLMCPYCATQEQEDYEDE